MSTFDQLLSQNTKLDSRFGTATRVSSTSKNQPKSARPLGSTSKKISTPLNNLHLDLTSVLKMTSKQVPVMM
jgi:hypothetical protein